MLLHAASICYTSSGSVAAFSHSNNRLIDPSKLRQTCYRQSIYHRGRRVQGKRREQDSSRLSDRPNPVPGHPVIHAYYSDLSKNMSDSVELQTTLGTFTVELYNRHAPRTCQNFAELARRGYYNNTVVSRQASPASIGQET